MKINLFTLAQIEYDKNKINFEKDNKIYTTNNIEKNKTKISQENLIATYAPNIAFGGALNIKKTNVEIIKQIQKIISGKKFNPDDANKLLSEITPKAQENINGVVKRFEKDGLTIKDYLKACCKETSLIYQTPDTIEKKC